MMRAVGYGDDDFKQPLVGVAHAWIEIMPCNFNHREQAEWVKEGIREAGGQFTANTMATAFEALGISPAGSSRVPAIDKHRRRDVMKAAGKRAVEMLKEDFRPSRVLKRENFDNAIAAVMATGGSTNAVLHLLACAREAGTPLALQDFDDISARTPLLADMKPWGRFTAVDMDRAGGIMLVLQRLAEAKVLNEHAMTVTGKMIGDEARAAKETHGQDVGHSTPEAADGGPIALVRDGDTILIDPESRRIDLQIPDAEVRGRRATTLPPEPRYRTGAMAKYARLVSSASEGAVTGLS